MGEVKGGQLLVEASGPRLWRKAFGAASDLSFGCLLA